MSIGAAVCVVVCASTARAVIHFREDFDQPPPYAFSEQRFGYSDRPCPTFHDEAGGVNGSGNHRIPLCDASYTNFNILFGTYFQLSEYYARFHVWVDPGFPNDGENWKLTYNHHRDGDDFVVWMRATSDGLGYQPAVYSSADGGRFKTEPVPTLYLPDFKGQWIAFEYYFRISTGELRLWLTTEDGRYDETLYIDVDDFVFDNASPITRFTVGSYWDGTGNADRYIRLDEVVISDQYNGPAAGAAPCADGESRSCYNGPGGTAGVGACTAGTQACGAGVWSGSCSGQVLPSAERCDDGADNDCDGATDLADSDCAPICTDADGDGHANAFCGGGDCNDSDPTVHPGTGCDEEADAPGAVTGGCECHGSGVGLGWLAGLGLMARRRRSGSDRVGVADRCGQLSIELRRNRQPSSAAIGSTRRYE